jgi:hypothetical protein
MASQIPIEAAADDADGRIAGLGRLLRGVGAAVLLAAASTFLLQHWQAGGDLERYAGFLGLTALLSAAGFFTGLRIGETKGARTFLALAAALVPAHFCILGGLLYSQFAWGSGPHPVAAYATWIAPSPAAALSATAGALVALTPVVLVSMLALARSKAGSLTAAFLGLNVLTLVPSREPQAVALLLALSVAGLAILESRILRRDVALRTFEGLLVRAMLLAPPVLMALRSMLHYELSALLGAVLFAAAALLSFALSREAELGLGPRLRLERVSALAAAGACLLGAKALGAAGLPDAAVLPAATLPYAALLALLSGFTVGRPAQWRGASAVVALGGTTANLLLYESALASFFCLAVSIAALAYAYGVRHRGLFAAGAACAVFALAEHVERAIELYAWSSWGSLALLGMAVIAAASLLERHHRALGSRLAAWRERVAGWEA